MNSELTRRVKESQSSMVESAKSLFDELELGHLRALIRLTIEFYYYLEHGSVEMAEALERGAQADYFENLPSASSNPFNKYDLRYTCESIRSGVDSFCTIHASYRILVGARASKIEWAMISSMESFKSQFDSMFNQFTNETNFENKCLLLLDLFKLQIVFAGVSYE